MENQKPPGGRGKMTGTASIEGAAEPCGEDGVLSEETTSTAQPHFSHPSPMKSCELPQKGGSENGSKNWSHLAVWILTWTPARLRYDTACPPQFTTAQCFLYAFVSAFTAANLYYNQPVLDVIAKTFDVTFERASLVATLMQAGYASGLLFICPLGDILRRRPFILSLIGLTANLWVGLYVTTSFTVFLALSFMAGVTSVTPQLMLPLVADMAPASRKATAISITTSGMMLGVLIARLLSGVVANYTYWRNIYWFSLGMQIVLLVLIFCFMPNYPPINSSGLSYVRALWTIIAMLLSEPVLVQACLIAFFISAIFTGFWTTLTFLLVSPPYEYSSVAIGLFSLVGIAAICSGPIYSRFVLNRYTPFLSSILGQALILIGCVVGTFSGEITVAGPIFQAVSIDIGIQCVQTANRMEIYTINVKGKNRANTAFMVSAFVGQLTGTAVGNRLYAQGGWKYSGFGTIGSIGLSLIVTFLKGPAGRSWIGWGSNWKLRSDDARTTRVESPENEQLPAGSVVYGNKVEKGV